MMNIVPKHGERAIIIGQTGSGKTAFARWLLSHMPGSIIYDTKIEPKFNSLSGRVICKDVVSGIEAYRKDDKNEVKYAVVRPSVVITQEPKLLDEMLYYHYENGRNLTAYLDETYQFHVNGKAGPGLLSLLTRGRSRGITTVMATQRPAWLSRFCFTESQKFYIFPVVDKRDWKTISEVVPEMDKMPKPPKYHFYYYDFDLPQPVLYSPIKLNDGEDKYTDELEDKRVWF